MGGHGHHGGGGRRRGFGRRGFGVTVLDASPDYVTSDCYRERLPDGSYVWRCPDGAMGFPASAYDRVAIRSDAGDIMPTLVTAETARAYIAETDAGYDTLNTTINSSRVPDDFKAAWTATYVGWKAFSDAARLSVGFFTAKAVMDQTDRWVQTLGNFSVQFHALSPSSPVPTMPSPPGQGVPDKSAASFLSGTTGLIVAGTVLAAVLFIGPHFSK